MKDFKKDFRTYDTLEDMTKQGLLDIRKGVDIASTYSAKESERVFREALPEAYTKFYNYVNGGKNKMRTIEFTEEDYKRVKCPLIPVNMRFEYLMLEHLYYYELSVDKQIQSRSKELFEFIKGFEEIDEGVYIKLCRMHVYLIDINTGIVRSKEFKQLQRQDGYIRVEKDTVYIVINDFKYKLYQKGKIIGTSWVIKATNREKGYKSFEVSKIGCFRVHTVMIALKYGIEVAKFVLGSNCFLTVEHKDKNPSNNAISNLCIYTSLSNKIKGENESYKAQDYIEIFEEMFIQNKYYNVR